MSTARFRSGPCPRDFALLPPGWSPRQRGRLFLEVAFAGDVLPAHPSKQSGPVRTHGQAVPELCWQAVGDAHVSEVMAWILPGHFLIPTESHVLH